MHSIGPQKHLPADAEQVRSRARIVNMLALYNWTLNEIAVIYKDIVLIDIRSGVNSVMIDSHLDGVNLPRNHEICVTVIVFKIIPIPTDHLFIQIVHPSIH